MSLNEEAAGQEFTKILSSAACSIEPLLLLGNLVRINRPSSVESLDNEYRNI
jgi:hypothetical protein